jgi:hypothetical protein
MLQFRTGLSAARSDDIASLKAVVIDWVSMAPFNAATTIHPLPRNSKNTRGFHNPVIGELLCPTDLNWQDPKYVFLIQVLTLAYI